MAPSSRMINRPFNTVLRGGLPPGKYPAAARWRKEYAQRVHALSSWFKSRLGLQFSLHKEALSERNCRSAWIFISAVTILA